MKLASPPTNDVDDFLKFSMTQEDPYEQEIPEILQDIDSQHQRQKQEQEEVEKQFQNQEEQQQEQQQNSQGTIPPLGIAKPELVQSVLENMGNEEKILEAIQDAEAYERESPEETIKREALSYGARLGESLLGGISDVLRLVLPDLEGDEPEELTGIKPGRFDLRKALPTTESLREFTKEKTGKYLEPKNQRQKATQEYISGVGASLPVMGPLAALAVPLVGQIAKEGIKWSGGSESEADLAKLGIMTVASIANLGNARGVAGQAMNVARDMIPQGLRISAGRTLNAFNRLRNQSWWRTGSTPSKAPAMQMVERIENQIANNGTLNLHDAMQLRRDINEARKSLGAFNIPPITDRGAARRYLDQVDRALVESMEHYGANVNPNWWRNYQVANQAFAVTERSGKIAQFIERHAKPLQSDMAKVLFHTGGAGLVSGIGLGGTAGVLSGAAGGAALLGQSYKIMNRMIRSPLIRSHYVEVLNAAASGNAALLNKALERFDKVALKHEYPKDSQRSLNK